MNNRNLFLKNASNSDKAFFWKHYCDSMRSHIEQIWGWDDEWQQSDFESRWLACDNQLIHFDDKNIGYIQTTHSTDEHYIMMLILLPEYRSKGFGGQLLSQIKASTSSKNIGLRVFKTNLKALAFYQSQEFTQVVNEGDFYYLKLKVHHPL